MNDGSDSSGSDFRGSGDSRVSLKNKLNEDLGKALERGDIKEAERLMNQLKSLN